MKIIWLSLVVLGISACSASAAEVYLAVGPGGDRMFSKDGRTWDNHISWGEPKHDQNDLNCAAFFKGTAYVGGGYFSGRLTATRDGKTWSEGVLPKSSPIFGMEILHDTLYAITLHGQVYKTSDGEHWTMVAPAKNPTPTHRVRITASGNGVIVGSGDFGPGLAFDPKTEKITVTQMAGQKDKNPNWKRVAYGNGVFVVCGQDGLLAETKDGLTWQNNETHPERGNISSVVWAGNGFLAAAEKQDTLFSKDGLEWKKFDTKAPNTLVRAGDWVYGWSWPPSKIKRSRDGANWEPVPNAKDYYAKDIVLGNLSGTGPPPKLQGSQSPRATTNSK